MSRITAFLAAALGGALLVAAVPVRDWSRVVAPAPQGSYRIGNPAAKVKLVEFVSYTCPHCRHFAEQSDAVLRGQMVKSGSTSVEFRNQIHDKLDLTAVVLARCTGPRRFLAYHDAVYAGQETWIPQAVAWDEANAAKNAGLSDGQKLKALADGAGLSAYARKAGMTAPEIAKCFADPAVLKRALEVSQATENVPSTPSFELNGTLITNVAWAGLEPRLRAVGAK